MLQIKQICKQYKTGDLVQNALNNVSLNLRDNEFVAILGPSGSGKTTLLNIIGGLDRYDSGDLIINGISTKKYTDRDWDSYRNHTIGFVFQSYNLIPHQTVLANVELALTISGISGAERRRRATKALEEVGLGNQLHKHPSEMSGGQMQRVAIARALVNNPDILLADEPTGALDSETSIQVMELLKEVARDRLVVMVTHNPELAERYATRIVTLKDGVIRSDTMPYEPDTQTLAAPVHKNMGRSSMSVLTSLTLSFNNLRTKKARTLHVIEQAKSSAIVQQQMADPQINVFTGEEFGADNSTSFDMSSMFSVDTDTLKNAFQFDTSALKFDLSGAFDLSAGSFDLSSLLDPDSFSLDLGDLPQPDMDMSSVFENMDLSISPEALQNMMQKILNGYKDYVVGNGILNLDKISFSAYMQTEQFQQLLASSISELLADANLQEQFSAAMQTVMESYSAQISQALQSQLSTAMNTAMQQMGTRISQQMESAIQKNIAQLGSQMENALKIDASAFQNAIHMNMTQEELAELMKSSMLSSTSTYDGNLQSLGYADLDDPSTISIYPKDFDCKALIVDALDAYNASAEANGEDDKVVRYTDVVGTLMTSVTKIINMISNMLVAFVSISLVVSSIMIGVITYISVLERRKEIGILRAIGASKRNISEVFNAETFIIGLCSGCMGVGLSLILLIPGNMLIHSIADSASVTAALPLQAALVLIALATLLTILGGLIPAKSASKCDPVKALRSE